MWILVCCCLGLDDVGDDGRGQFDEVEDEDVRSLCFDVVGTECGAGEVLNVLGDDDL